ncbi:MAG: fibronectin type III domain-containing protein [Acidimicrobiaceae bacterium]|nr:fibronectin type III domain-containing protein [Candidatus Poribacteria bacterium]MYI37335.1 fibronectin type III domain-containing protein [Acidimicrobiaceae bacterium]
MAFECSAEIIASFEAGPIEAVINILGDAYNIEYGQYFRVPFEYNIGRPPVTRSPFIARFRNIGSPGGPLPTLIYITPAAPRVDGVAADQKQNGVILAYPPSAEEIEVYHMLEEYDDLPALNFEVTIEMFQPDADGYESRRITGNSPITMTCTEYNSYVKCSLSVPETIEDVPVNVQTQADVNVVDRTGQLPQQFTTLWTDILDHTLIINYDYIEGLTQADADPSLWVQFLAAVLLILENPETTTGEVEVQLETRAAMSNADPNFARARREVLERWAEGSSGNKWVYRGSTPIQYDGTTLNQGDEYTSAEGALVPVPSDMVFGEVSTDITFPTRTSAPSPILNLKVIRYTSPRVDTIVVEVGWDAPRDTGRSGIIRYEYEIQERARAYTGVDQTTTGTMFSTVIRIGVAYKARVRAVNAAEKKTDWAEINITAYTR